MLTVFCYVRQQLEAGSSLSLSNDTSLGIDNLDGNIS